jgi:hypothetical protein
MILKGYFRLCLIPKAVGLASRHCPKTRPLAVAELWALGRLRRKGGGIWFKAGQLQVTVGKKA